jgi:murein DD-endopeptidase MepM/ murein hydrolase activator NlpD
MIIVLSVDKPSIMADLIGSQRVERRRPAFHGWLSQAAFSGGAQNIGELKQRPARRRSLLGGRIKKRPVHFGGRANNNRAGRLANFFEAQLFAIKEARRGGALKRRKRFLAEVPNREAKKNTSAAGNSEFIFVDDAAAESQAENQENQFEETSLPDNQIRSFFKALLAPAVIVSVGIYFSFFSPWTIPEDMQVDAGEILREDTLLMHDMAAYAGVLHEEAPEEGEDIPLDLMETFAWQSYTVKRGDSVYKIALDHAISMDAIIAGNGLTNARRLYQGQEIRIPNMDGIPYTVRRGDSLLKISAAQGVPLMAILDANDLDSETINPGTVVFIPGAKMKSEDLKLALGELFIYPVRGRLTDSYGWRNDPISGVRRYHAALDLAAPTGTLLIAAMDGRVATVGSNATYGKFIILSHAGGYQTLYAHLSVVSVKQGAWAAQGSKIGEVGSTGYSTGPHLHFAIYKNGRAVNPLDFLHP